MSQLLLNFADPDVAPACTCGPDCDDICTGTNCGCKGCRWSCEDFDTLTEEERELIPVCTQCGSADCPGKCKGDGIVRGKRPKGWVVREWSVEEIEAIR